ncbi:hypothetical protein BC829DRAFT_419508 [Chytridium lagenaria]|nr:hypothetical protein BC829DRAFT_419508 [Chytridium lagenaria]
MNPSSSGDVIAAEAATDDGLLLPPSYVFDPNSDDEYCDLPGYSGPSIPAPPALLPLPFTPEASTDNHLIPHIPDYIALVKKIRSLKHAEPQRTAQIEIIKTLMRSIREARLKLSSLQERQALEAKDVERIGKKFSIMSLKAKMNGNLEQAKQKELAELEEANAAVEAQEIILYENRLLLEKAEEERDRLSSLILELQDARLSLIKLLNTAFESSFETNPTDHSLILSLTHHNPILVDLDSDVRTHKTALNFMIAAYTELTPILKLFDDNTKYHNPRYKDQVLPERVSIIREWRHIRVEARGGLRLAGNFVKNATNTLPTVAEKLGSSNIGKSTFLFYLTNYPIFPTPSFTNRFSEVYTEWIHHIHDGYRVTNRLHHITNQVANTVSWLQEADDFLVTTRTETIQHMTNIRRILTKYRVGCFDVTAIAQGEIEHEVVTDVEELLPNGGVVGEVAVGGLVVLPPL